MLTQIKAQILAPHQKKKKPQEIHIFIYHSIDTIHKI